MEENKIIAIVLCIAFVLTLLISIQIFYLRSKIGNFQTSLLTSQMTQQAEILQSSNQDRSNLKIYSIVVDIDLTKLINNTKSQEYNDIMEKIAPHIFSIPHICDDKLKSVRLSCNSPGILVLQNSQGSVSLYNDARSDSLMYVMVDGYLYFIHVSDYLTKYIQNSYTQYKQYNIVVLYTINTSANKVTDGLNCRLELQPFFGSLSTAPVHHNILNTINNPKSKIVHVLGIFK